MSKTCVATPTLPVENSLPTKPCFPQLCICVCRVRRGGKIRAQKSKTSDQTPFVSCVTLGRSLCLSDLGFFGVKWERFYSEWQSLGYRRDCM